MPTTHYDVLGVTSRATVTQIRSAYVEKARAMHPDTHAGQPTEELVDARRAMQDVNEAWRILRDPARRAAYDRSLRAPTPAWTPPGPPSATAPQPTDDWLDRPYPRHAAEPGDLTVAVVRAAPWVAVVIVLIAIFVFTAFARGDDAPSTELIGQCIDTDSGRAVEVPCDGPTDGRVVSVVDDAGSCRGGSVAKIVSGGTWYCVRPPDAD